MSVDVGRVKVPLLLIELIIGEVIVLLVKVWVPVKVTTVESIDIVPLVVIDPSRKTCSCSN